MNHSKFLKQWAVWTIFLVAMVGAFNLFIDPYNLFGTVQIEHVNATKPASGRKVRISSPYAALRYKPQVIIAGNSRPEMGLNPGNICFKKYDFNVYNIGIPGSSVYMQVRLIQNTLSTQTEKLVLYGIDFIDFLIDFNDLLDTTEWPPARQDFEDRLRITASGSINTTYWQQYAKDHLQALFSIDALSDSILTIALQGREEYTTRTERGFNPAKAYYANIIRNEGQWVLFEQKLREVARRLTLHGYSIYGRSNQWSRNFEAIEQLIGMAKRQGVKLILFINPYHALYIEEIYRSGYGNMFEQWKRQMAAVATSHGIELFDFSGYNEYSTEIPPRPEDKLQVLSWFWEPAHYRERLGNLMLQRMLPHCSGKLVEPANFGRLLTTTTVNEGIEAFHGARSQFVKLNPSLINHLATLMMMHMSRSTQIEQAAPLKSVVSLSP